MKSTKNISTEIVFTAKAPDAQPVRLTGLSADALSRPENIRQVMELLGMPEGTVARILHTTEDVIVR